MCLLFRAYNFVWFLNRKHWKSHMQYMHMNSIESHEGTSFHPTHSFFRSFFPTHFIVNILINDLSVERTVLLNSNTIYIYVCDSQGALTCLYVCTSTRYKWNVDVTGIRLVGVLSSPTIAQAYQLHSFSFLFLYCVNMFAPSSQNKTKKKREK